MQRRFCLLPALLLGALAVPAAAADPVTSSRALQDWYALGGPIMHGLSGLSVLVAAVFLERRIALRRGAIAPASLVRAIDAGDTPLSARAIGARSALARVVGAGLHARGASASQAAAERAGSTEVARMHRHLPLLAALGNLATMLGLLGTVLGMIQAFELIAEVGTGDAKVVAGGIFHALVTTAAGLAVGIAALGGHAILRRRVDAFALELEECASRALARLEQPIARSEAAPHGETALAGSS